MVLVAYQGPCCGRVVLITTGLISDFGPLYLDIMGDGEWRHFTGQYTLGWQAIVNGDVVKAQVAYHTMASDFPEQTSLQAADGVAATVVVTVEDGTWLFDLMTEAVFLEVVGICRVVLILTDLAQCFAVEY